MDVPKNTRFSINYFTSIGLGILTEEMREYLNVSAVFPLGAVALVRFHRLDAMIPVQFHRLVEAYAVIPVPFHPLANMDAVAPVLFHLCPVVAVAEDMLMTSKIWSELLCILCNDYSSESTKKSMNDYYLYLVGKYAKTNQSRGLQKQ